MKRQLAGADYARIINESLSIAEQARVLYKRKIFNHLSAHYWGSPRGKVQIDTYVMIQEKNSLSLSPCTPRRLANKPNPKVTNKQSNPDQNLNTTRSEPQLACPLCAHLIGTFGLPSCYAFGFSLARARSSRLPPRGSTCLIAISHLATPGFLQLCMTSTPSQ